MRKKTAKFVIFISFVLSAIIFFELLFSEGGVRTYRVLKQEIRSLKTEVEELKGKKRKLEAEIWRLNGDDTYIEKIARRDYDFLRKNEIILKFVEMGK